MQIAGVVILYYPVESEILRNIHSYLNAVDHLYVLDNTPIADKGTSEWFENLTWQIDYIQNERNIGIAAALNKAAAIAFNKGYKWLLTMDQDSFFEPKEVNNYFSFFLEKFIQREDIAIVCPKNEYNKEVATNGTAFHEVLKAITSGSLLNLEVWNKVKGFDEKLFIDEVDFEYCYRCVINGYKIIELNNIYLTHQLGVKKEVGYFSFLKKSKRVLHSPLRLYYMVRNHFYVSSKYAQHFPEEIRERRKQLFVTIKNNLLFSGKALKVIGYVIKGYVDYKQNRFS